MKKNKNTTLDCNIINIKIHSPQNDKQKLYSEAMYKVFNLDKFQVNIGHKMGLVLKNMNTKEFPKTIFSDMFFEADYLNLEVLQGTFIKFKLEDENDKYYNIVDKELKSGNPDSHIKPNAHEIHFYFIPSIHRILLPLNSKLSPIKLKLFFEEALTKIYENTKYFNIDISKSSEEIEKIFTFRQLRRLKLNVSYTNDDLGDAAKMFVDAAFKEANIHKAQTNYEAKARESLNMDSKFIRGGIELSKENGDLIASGINEYGNKEVINTKNKFEEVKIPVDTSSDVNFLKSLLKSVLQIWRKP